MWCDHDTANLELSLLCYFHAWTFCLFCFLLFFQLCFYRTQVRPLPCLVSPSVFPVAETWLMWPWHLEMLSSCNLSLLMLNWIVGFVKVVTWIFTVLVTCISRPLPNKTKLKFDQYFEKVLNWIVAFFKVVTWLCQNCYMYFSNL